MPYLAPENQKQIAMSKTNRQLPTEPPFNEVTIENIGGFISAISDVICVHVDKTDISDNFELEKLLAQLFLLERMNETLSSELSIHILKLEHERRQRNDNASL